MSFCIALQGDGTAMTNPKELAAKLRIAIHVESLVISPRNSVLAELAKQAAEYLEGQADLPVGVIRNSVIEECLIELCKPLIALQMGEMERGRPGAVAVHPHESIWKDAMNAVRALKTPNTADPSTYQYDTSQYLSLRPLSELKNRPVPKVTDPSAELLKRASIMSGMLQMGERIPFGSDAALIDELRTALDTAASGRTPTPYDSSSNEGLK
jgi:hypothetical protein